jgi:hypothetical protein
MLYTKHLGDSSILRRQKRSLTWFSRSARWLLQKGNRRFAQGRYAPDNRRFAQGPDLQGKPK